MKYLKLGVLCAVFLLGGFLWGQSLQPQPAIAPTVSEQSATTSSMMFAFDNQTFKVVTIPWRENLNLFDATKEAAEANNLAFESKDYGELGVLITRIGEKTNGDNNNYWQYWVNNEQIQTATNNYTLKAGDVIQWYFRKSEM